MKTADAIVVSNLSKKFRLFRNPKERLFEALHPSRRKYHTEHWALNDVSFRVGRGEIVGILGRNGSGKSTLLQIICRVMEPTSGNVQSHGRISALLELGAGFNPEFTGRENVILNGALHGFSMSQMVRRMPEIEAFADIGEFFDQPVKVYSSGMFTRVAFSAAITIDPDILVVDEALSVGDSKFQHRCFQKIRSFVDAGKTILVVSHSTDTLLRLCSRGVVLENGSAVFEGAIAQAVNEYQKLLFGSPSSPDEIVQLDLNRPQTEDVQSPSHKLTLSTAGRRREDIIVQKSSYNFHETRIGSGKARIVDFDLIAAGRANPHEIRTHDECELLIKIVAIEDVALSVGFAVVSLDGTYVSGTNMKMMGQSPLVLAGGEVRVVSVMWHAHLVGGEYFLNLGCTEEIDGEESYVDVRRSVCRLKVADTPGTVGFCELNVTIRVSE